MPERRRGLGRLVAPLLCLAIGAGLGWSGARRTEAAGTAPASESYATARVERRDLEATVLATGVVRPRVGAQVAVGSRVSGVLRRLHVTVGDRVSAGQLLAELDPVELEAAVQRAGATLEDAAAERTWAEGELERQRRMAEQGVAPPVDLASAQRAFATAAARESAARASLDGARIQLGYTRIQAPIAGVVASISTQEGETVAASFAAPTFLTIVDLDRLEVQAYVDETDIGRIEVGQRARFSVDTFPDEMFGGRVTAVRPSPELRDNVVSYVTLIEIERRPGFTLRPEMTATTRIEVEGVEAALSVPNGALRRDASGSFVLVPGASGLDRRAVEVGFRGAEHTELLSGVTEDERVAVGVIRPCGSAEKNEEHAENADRGAASSARGRT